MGHLLLSSGLRRPYRRLISGDLLKHQRRILPGRIIDDHPAVSGGLLNTLIPSEKFRIKIGQRLGIPAVHHDRSQFHICTAPLNVAPEALFPHRRKFRPEGNLALRQDFSTGRSDRGCFNKSFRKHLTNILLYSNLLYRNKPYRNRYQQHRVPESCGNKLNRTQS